MEIKKTELRAKPAGEIGNPDTLHTLRNRAVKQNMANGLRLCKTHLKSGVNIYTP